MSLPINTAPSSRVLPFAALQYKQYDLPCYQTSLSIAVAFSTLLKSACIALCDSKLNFNGDSNFHLTHSRINVSCAFGNDASILMVPYKSRSLSKLLIQTIHILISQTWFLVSIQNPFILDEYQCGWENWYDRLDYV